MKSHFFAYISRMRFIQRWALMRNTAPENVQEHSHQELQGVYGPILTQSDPEVRQVVKAADKLSAYIKCVEELKAGNNEFRQAAGQTRKALEGYELPEVTYFLETFMDSFSLTLDELQ